VYAYYYAHTVRKSRLLPLRSQQLWPYHVAFRFYSFSLFFKEPYTESYPTLETVFHETYFLLRVSSEAEESVVEDETAFAFSSTEPSILVSLITTKYLRQNRHTLQIQGIVIGKNK
jgi:hypothetical protein